MHIREKLNSESVTRKGLAPFLPFLFFVASGLVSVFLRQDGNWDLRNYHFYNAYAFLNNRLLFDVAPAQLQTFLNPLLDVPIYMLIRNLSPMTVGFLLGGIQGFNIWLIYKITHDILPGVADRSRELISVGAGIAGYLGAANISEVGTAFGDNLASLFVLAALLIIVWSTEPEKMGGLSYTRKSVIASGLLLGVVTGLKFVMAVYTLAFFLALLLMNVPWKNKLKGLFLSGIAVGTGFSITAGYWMSTLWRNFHSPLFPFYNRIFRSPFYESVKFTDSRFFPQNIHEVLFYPFYFIKTQKLVSELPFRDSRLALCYMLICAYILVHLYKTIRNNNLLRDPENAEAKDKDENNYYFLIVFFVASYILWQYMFSIYRYAIILEFLSPIIIVLTIKHIFPTPKTFIRLSFILFVLIIFTSRPMNWGRVPWSGDFFEVRISPDIHTDNSIVIIAGLEPLAYVIPYFPKTARFVRVQSNLTNPYADTLLQTEIKSILRQQGAPKYILYKENNHKDDIALDKTLSLYRIGIDKSDCWAVSSKLDNDLLLCKVGSLDESKSAFLPGPSAPP